MTFRRAPLSISWVFFIATMASAQGRSSSSGWPSAELANSAKSAADVLWSTILTRCGDSYYYAGSGLDNLTKTGGPRPYKNVFDGDITEYRGVYTFIQPPTQMSAAMALNVESEGTEEGGTAVMVSTTFRWGFRRAGRWEPWIDGPLSKIPLDSLRSARGTGQLAASQLSSVTSALGAASGGTIRVHMQRKSGQWLFNFEGMLGFTQRSEYDLKGDAPYVCEGTPGTITAPPALPGSPEPTGPTKGLQKQPGSSRTPPTPSGEAVWTDSETGLTWQRKDHAEGVSWNEAVDYCKNLRVGSYADWRLPELDELTPLYDAKQTGPGHEYLQENNFHIRGHLSVSGEEWSNTDGQSPGEAWVFFYNYGNRASISRSSRNRHVLCVHGKRAQGSAREETWTDPATGLIWQHRDNGANVNWNEAVDYCRNLHLSDHSDWRLPEIDELQAMYDTSQSVRGYDEYAVNTYHIKGQIQLSVTSILWSQTQTSNGLAKGFDLYNGRQNTPYTLKAHNGTRALCVRDSGDEKKHAEDTNTGSTNTGNTKTDNKVSPPVASPVVHSGLFGQAFQKLATKCDAGDAKSCETAGFDCERGLGVDTNFQAAKTYYAKACSMGRKSGCSKAQ